ncbi:MAG: hypothetical protein WKG07_47160 [Hymenobacter sp.]
MRLTVETYYKALYNQIDYRNGTGLRGNFDVEASLLYGKGRAYGVEFLLRKDLGRFTGWLGYTLSRSERRFTQINDGAWFRARQDRPHDLSVVGIYQLNPEVELLGHLPGQHRQRGHVSRWSKYEVAGQVVSYYGLRNADRLPAYVRLDLGATYEKPNQEGHRFRSSWSFSIYNALGRENPYSIRFQPDPNGGLGRNSRPCKRRCFRRVPCLGHL